MKKLEESSDKFEVFSADGKYVGSIGLWFGIPMSKENIISAAPEMYEALYGLIEVVCDDCKCHKCANGQRVQAAEAALSKTTGESEANNGK